MDARNALATVTNDRKLPATTSDETAELIAVAVKNFVTNDKK
jgi:hypothetical protein